MNGQEDQASVYSPANDTAARFVAYFGPYLFWGAVCVIASGIVLLG